MREGEREGGDPKSLHGCAWKAKERDPEHDRERGREETVRIEGEGRERETHTRGASAAAMPMDTVGLSYQSVDHIYGVRARVSQRGRHLRRILHRLKRRAATGGTAGGTVA